MINENVPLYQIESLSDLTFRSARRLAVGLDG